MTRRRRCCATERSSRRRRRSASPGASTTRGFPPKPRRICLQEAGIAASDLQAVAFYERPLVKWDRLLETFLGYAPGGFELFEEAMPVWAQLKLQLPSRIRAELPGFTGDLYFVDHHEVARRQRVLSVAVRRRRHPDGRCGGRMEHQRTRARVTATGSRSVTSSGFRIRSACCIRRSPTTPAFG